MQRKLATWALTDKTRRVDRLLRLISHPIWLQHAANFTLSSSGLNTAGIDGITKTYLQDNLEGYLQDIRLMLLSDEYQPMPARRVFIPKANGKQHFTR
ncbi:hypothetical protein A5320_18310 [Rheinheimera sp. SA_1]|nr:hypothetical protein A5320_18310 [Rheinheimera sp. SA_1]